MARIVAVADAFDAMTSNRHYRKARARQEAVDELQRCAGTQFDPKVVEVFLSSLDEAVSLGSGDLFAANEEILVEAGA